MRLNEKKTEAITIVGILSVVSIITGIIANLSEIHRNNIEIQNATEPTAIMEETTSPIFIEAVTESVTEISEMQTESVVSTNPENNDYIRITETVEPVAFAYLEQFPIIESGRYIGNEGDSFVYPIGKHKYSRGNTCIDGISYEHGIEGWVARWNYKSESSWAYSIFEFQNKYSLLSGECKLIESYNTSDFNSTLEFWSDDQLLQSYLLTPDTIPFEINLDVSGCSNLKVYFYDNEAKSGGTSFGLIGMKLT